MKSLPKKIYRFLASLKLAVVLLVALAAILAAATYYESLYDAKTAQHLVYGSWWFALFLCTLGVNVFCAASIRYPWKKHQTGFAITHAGIITLLVGSLITMSWGVDGGMALVEGETGTQIMIDKPVLVVSGPDGNSSRIPAEFRWSPPREGRPYRYPVGAGVTAVVDRYVHNALEEVDYVESDGGPAAVRIRLHNERVDVADWLAAGGAPLEMGPARLELVTASSREDLEWLLSPDRPEPDSYGTLRVLWSGEPFELDVAELVHARRADLGDTGASVELVRHLPHAVVRDEQLVSDSDEFNNPAMELRIKDAEGDAETWLVFAFLQDFDTKTDQTGKTLPLRLVYDYEPPREGPRGSLELIAGQDGTLHYRLGSGKTGRVEVGEEVSTGWMDLRFQVERFLPAARRRSTFRDLELANGEEGPPPAIRVALEGSKNPGPHWLRQGDTVTGETDEGALVLGYGLRTVDAGFPLTLVDFQIGYDPGTRSPSSYKSVVRVEGVEHVIQMNEPLHRNGFTFYQSSFQEIDGEPVLSVLSVARDPGIWVKYTGSLMIVLGIATMFYIRPYQLRKGRRDAPGEAS